MNRGERGGIFFRFLFLIFLLGLCAVLYVARRPLLRAAGDFWMVQDPVEHADVIVLISDDDYTADRAARAAEIYRQGWAPQVVASGRMMRPYFGVSELMSRDLQTRGVPESAVVRFDHHAENTLDEARALRGFVTSHGWRRVLLVTSNYHTRRARYIFQRVFEPAVTVHVVGATDPAFDPDSWWESRIGVKTFFYETLGMGVAWWELRDSAHPNAGPAPAAPAALLFHSHAPVFVTRRK